MTKYIQTNKQGYVVSITDEELLVDLFGGSPKHYRSVSDSEAENIKKSLEASHKEGNGLHIDDIVSFQKK